MSLIAQALQKSGYASPDSGKSPRGPQFRWGYGLALMVFAGVSLTLSARAALQSKHAGPALEKPRVTATPTQRSGVALLRSADHPLRLSGTIRGNDGKNVALINNQVVEEGASIQGAKLVRVSDDQVELEQEGSLKTLRLP